jgi:hypothetical protein
VSLAMRAKRRYIKVKDIENLAVDKFNINGKGITFLDLISKRLALHKGQAKATLKRCLKENIVFTLGNYRPQRYYPTCFKSKILNTHGSKILPVQPTGVPYYTKPNSKHPLASCLEPIIIQTLEGYVLPMLPAAPLYIHNLHFKLTIIPQCYVELNLPRWKGNKFGKYMSEIIGTTSVTYVFYSGGTVDVHARCSNYPYKLENEADVSNLIAFFGQIRDRLITSLMDRHERIVPPIMFWELSQCDLNRDIKVTHLLHITGIKIQVKHLTHLFRIYIKSMGEDTVCRVEENIQPNKPAVQALNEILNPTEKVVKQLQEINRKIDSALFKRRIDKNENEGVENLVDDDRGGGAALT